MRFSLIAVVAVLLVGCPRYAYIEAFNNTSETLSIYANDKVLSVEPGDAIRFPLDHSFEVRSARGTWIYPRSVPHGGEDGPFFDGTLRIQIEEDGTAYALKIDSEAPITNFEDQPEEYPLRPVSAPAP